MINYSIFKSYDIRGIYPKEINEEIAYRIGQAFVEKTKAKKLIVGRDGRLSSPVIFESLVKGIADRGVDVYNIGEVPTECVYFSVGKYGYDAGIMITASHNPKEYNGFKMVKQENNFVRIVKGKDLIPAITNFDLPKAKKKGNIKSLDIWQDYLNHLFSFVDVNSIKPFKVILDAGNGMAGVVLPKIIPKLLIEAIPFNFNLDGNFPAGTPNPLLEGGTRLISQTVEREKADFGFIFDGDADRIFLIDEKGEFVRADLTLLFLAKYFLKKYPGSAISYNLICSKAVPEFIKKWGGIPIRTPVGFVNISEGIIKNDGVMGGELSGHYSFKDSFYLDSGFIAFLVLLEIISQENKKVSEAVSEFGLYAKLPEINFEVENKEKIINKAKEKYADGRQDFLDGLTVEYNNWWFNLRPSQTEPLLRLTIEADNEKLLKAKEKELKDFIIKEK